MSADTFELTMQDPPRMNERLSDLSDLVGETILAAFEFTSNGEFVLVTENKNWIVIDADVDFGEEAPTLTVKRARHYGKEETMADYVKPRDLLDAGVINAAVFQELQAKADEQEAAEKARKAAYLRSALAKLEGGA